MDVEDEPPGTTHTDVGSAHNRRERLWAGFTACLREDPGIHAGGEWLDKVVIQQYQSTQHQKSAQSKV